MAKRRRGPPPDPNSKHGRALGRRAHVNRIVDQLDRSFGTLPMLFLKTDIEKQIPADVRDVNLRRSVTTAFLRRRGALPLGSHSRDHQHFNLWAREDCEAVRKMTKGQRTRSVLGEPPSPQPPRQYCPSTLSDWKAEYAALHANMTAFGFDGRPWEVWRKPFDRKARRTPAEDSTSPQPSPAIARTGSGGIDGRPAEN